MIFLSSARSDEVLAAMRDELRAWAQASGVDLWQFEEHAKSYWDGIGFPASVAVCLEQVDKCDLYLAIFHGAYGGSANSHAASVALTDLELFEAVRGGKPVRFYIVEPHEPGPELKALLTLVHTLVPNSFGRSGTARGILAVIKDDIARHLSRRGLRAPYHARAFQRYKSAVTFLRRDELDSVEGLQVLPAGLSISSAHCPVEMLERGLRTANAIPDPAQRESRLSALLPDLATVPYADRSCAAYHGVWDGYCESWLGATAWRGHHNSLRLGRLAMLNSQMAIRCLMATGHDRQALAGRPLPPTGTIGDSGPWIRVFTVGGALASEYYSLAKEQRSRADRNRFLRRGLDFLNVATRARELVVNYERSRLLAGLAAIRGHVYLELRDQTLDPAAAFEESLRLRVDGGMSTVAVAEAKADLGHVMVRYGLWNKGHELLVQGTRELEAGRGKGFAARAKFKLAECYLRRGWLRDAVRQVSEADAICALHKIERRGVTGALPRLTLRCLRIIGSHLMRVQARETASGYEYTT